MLTIPLITITITTGQLSINRNTYRPHPNLLPLLHAPSRPRSTLFRPIPYTAQVACIRYRPLSR